MEFARDRELVHLRYELRRLLADGAAGADRADVGRKEASPLLDRLRQLAIDEASHGRTLDSEVDRWATTFGL